MVIKQLFVFGNEYLKEDNLALKVAKFIKDIELIYCTSPDDLLDYDDIKIIDVVRGIEEPIIIEDIDQLKTRKIISLHDFDLAYFLKLMKELDIKKKIKIIGIPQVGDPEELAEKVKKWI